MSLQIKTTVLVVALLLQFSTAEALRNKPNKRWGTKAVTTGLLLATLANPANAFIYNKGGQKGIGLDFTIGNVTFDFQWVTNGEKGWRLFRSLEHTTLGDKTAYLMINGISLGKKCELGRLEVSAKHDGKHQGIYLAGPSYDSNTNRASISATLGEKGAKKRPLVLGHETSLLAGGNAPIAKAGAGFREGGLHASISLGANEKDRGHDNSFGVQSRSKAGPLKGRAFVGVAEVFGTMCVVPPVPEVEWVNK